ncbi:MAG: hypothetical protein JSW63_00745 [Ignavibacterium sp.]|nr:MAG: hypothetical protein JSW63_00745 [Ignavibacterium sp.]
MMKFFIHTFFVLLIQLASLYAHEPNKAYFDFWLEDNEIIVRAEFPWTLRIALLNANPQLKESRSQEDFNNALFAYFSNAIIIEEGNKKVKLLTLNQLPQDHSHSVIYELVFGDVENLEGVNITNVCLHELYDDQQNYNTISLAGKNTFSIITKKNHPTFTIPIE